MDLTSPNSSNKIFCLVGPSGSGKSTIARSIPLPEIVSYKTRKMRKDEKEGVDGYFITESEFLKMDKQDLWIAKTNYCGNYYGITQGELFPLEQSHMLYVIDWDGVITLKEALDQLKGYSSEQVRTIFIHAPRYDLEARLKYQRKESNDIVKVRLDKADQEYAISGRCDYVVENKNGELDSALSEIMKIILKETFDLHEESK